MSCPDERIHLLYAEELLEGDERRSFEMHLVSCPACRRAVVALRDEASLLADVLQERERAAFAPSRERPHGRGLPVGLVAGLLGAVAAAALALTAIGFLLEGRLPGGLDVLNPLRLLGAYEMAFDLVFLLRDRAPGVVALAVSLGVLASVAAALSFAAGALYRRLYGAAAAVLLVLAGTPAAPADAMVVRADEEIRVAAGEQVEESMALSGDVVSLDGVVQGDVFAVAERMTISGTVHGNLYLLVREVEITGRVDGTVHGVVRALRIDGDVQGSVYAVSASLALDDEGRIGRDLHLVGEEGVLRGRVGRDVGFGGDRLELRGEVVRDVEAGWADQVFLHDTARIGGDVALALRDPSDLERAPGAQVAGEVEIRPREPLHERGLAPHRRPGFYLFHGLALVAAFLFGLLLRGVAPVLLRGDPHTAGEFFRALGIGFLALLATPIAIVLLALTLVGLPIAALGLFAFLTLLYTAEIAVGAWIGRRLLPPRDESLLEFARALALGLLLVGLASHVPVVGAAVAVVALLVGLGLLVEQLRRTRPLTARGA